MHHSLFPLPCSFRLASADFSVLGCRRLNQGYEGRPAIFSGRFDGEFHAGRVLYPVVGSLLNWTSGRALPSAKRGSSWNALQAANKHFRGRGAVEIGDS
jgi:hypothetical protein